MHLCPLLPAVIVCVVLKHGFKVTGLIGPLLVVLKSYIQKKQNK